MIMLDSETALVYDTNDLREAVDSDNGVNLVYFGADITLSYGITIYPGKPSLTFDGTYQGVTYTFTDMDSSTTANTIGIRSFSNIVITFKNINLVGRNYYGIPFVPNSISDNGVSTIYENVTYIGTQINHNPYGFTRFTDCNITVNNNEAAEANRIEISGNTTIVKTNRENAVFWFRGSSSHKPSLRILPGANVSITTEYYFIYENYSPDIIIEQGANVSIGTDSGMVYSASHTINSILVEENASFRFTQQTNRGLPSLCIDGPLTVNEGASFYMQANFNNSNRLIRFTGNSGGLYINNPKSFVLYNRGSSSATAFQFVSTIPFTLRGGQVNYWEDATLFPSAGTFEDPPLHKWNRPSYASFTLQGTASNTATNITFNDFTPEELADLPPFSDLKLNNARVFAVGHIPLEIYSTVLTRSVDGATEPFANVKIKLFPSYFDDPHTAIADVAGAFTIVPSTPMPYSDSVEVFSNTPFLIVSSVMGVQEEDVLYIESAPTLISFLKWPLSGFDDIILPRDSENKDSRVTVVDTRMERTDWQLSVSISGPLKTQENDVLSNAVVFITEDGDILTLQTEFLPVLVGRHGESNTLLLEWDENRGLLARITESIRSGKRYTTHLSWDVTPIVDQPEEED